MLTISPRWFKNERLGFSVTYHEGNRPRQYHPDFLVTAREADGREVLWVIETKGEIRPNTKLKSAAAELWCQRMSTTRYGSGGTETAKRSSPRDGSKPLGWGASTSGCSYAARSAVPWSPRFGTATTWSSAMARRSSTLPAV